MKTLHTIYNNFAKRNLSFLRFLLVMLLTLMVSVEVWSATTNHTCSSTSGTIVSSKITFTTTSATWNSPQCRIAANGSITFTLTGVSVTEIAMGFSSSGYVGKWTSSGGGSFTTSNTNVTWSGSANPGTLTFTTSSAARLKTISVTYETAASYTVTWTINPTAGGSLSAPSGNSITVSPNAAYTYGSPAYTVTYGSATVSKSDNTFTATPSANCTIRINMVEKPKYTVTLMDDTDNPLSQTSAGAAITLPPRVGCDGYTFAGWTKSWNTPQTSWTTTAPTIIPDGSYTPTANESLYPVYTKTEGGGSEPIAYSAGDVGSFIIASNVGNKWYAIPENPTLSSGKITGVEITVSQTAGGVKYVSTANAEGFTWTIADATNGQTISDGSKYIYHSNGGYSGTNLAYGNSTSYTWKIEKETNGLTFIGMSGSTTNSRGLLFNGSVFGGYALSNEGNAEYYRIQVLPIGGGSTTSYISVPDCDPCNALQAPNVTAKNITTNSFTLSWAAVPGATSYNVYNYTTDEGYETTDLTYTFNGLDPNTEYDWEVEAVSATCNGKGTTGTTTTLKTYTITWKNADGTVLETDENVPHGTTPTYDGETPTQAATEQYTYTFSGWSPDVYAADKDQIYTAQFDETTRQYIVTFDANGHGTAPDQQSVDYGTKATEPTEPTAFGYTFGGWYKEAGCTNVWDFANDVVTGNITLYAKWTEKDLTNYRTACDVLCYDAYSFHTGDDDVKTKNTGTCFEQLDNTIEWQITNYTIPADKNYFVGYLGYYYDDNLGTNNARSAVKTWAEEMYIAPAMDSDDATNSPKLGQATGAVGTLRIFDNSNWNNLYVGFIPDGYKLKFGTTEYAFTKTNGTEYRSEAVVEYNSTTADKNVSVGIVDADGKYVTTNHSQEMIHIFVKDNCGWRNDDAKLAIYYWGGSEGWCGFLKTVPGDETLFEGWIPSNATDLKFVRYNSNQSNPGSWDYENAIWNSTGNLTIDGNLFTITDWGTGTWSTYEKYGQFAMHDNSKSKNWYVHFIPHNALKYDKNANEATGTMNVQTVVYDAEDKNVTVAECGFTRTGYRFVKWRKDNTNTYYNSGVTIDLDKDITLYAQWEKEYTVTYNANGGVTTCVDNNIYIQGDEVTVCTEIPSKEGHTFLGWSDGTNTYSAGATFTMPASDVTLTAQWQINQYTVTLNPNYPAGKTGTFTDKEGNTVNGNLVLTYDYNTTSMSLTDLYQSIELDGYKFNGWFSATVGGSPWTQTGEIKKNVTVYAQWTKLYGITLSENGTTKELEPQTSTSYTLPTELSVGTCDNDENELVGWSTVTIPTPGDKPTTDFYDLGETVTLTKDQTTFYAVFAKPGGASVWAKTDIANIDSDDEVVITMKFGKTVYALTNGNGTSKAPAATVVEVEDNTILPNQISDEITWNIEKDNNNLTIHPNGITNKWLYCTNDNDGVRVGTNANKVFTIDAQTGYMKNNSTTRFVGVYTGNPDWRCYTNTTGNIANQTLAFYTKTSSLTNYTTTCLSKHSIIYDFNGGEGNCENEKVTHGEDYTICDEEPTNAGYTFLYWANGEDTYAPGTTIENVQADITLTATWQEKEKYTLTFNDQGDTKEFQYIESLPVEMQEPWADICSGPIQYVFDGWATASVNNGPAEYEKVDFSTFTMPAENTTLYAVYRYAEEGSGDDDYHLVEEELTDYSGDYLVVSYDNNYAMSTSAEGKIGTNTYAAYVDISEYYADKIIKSNSTTDTYVFTATKTTNGYSLCCKQNNTYLAILNTSTGTGPVLRYYEESDYNTNLSECEWSIGVGSISNYAHSSYNQYIRWNDNPKRFAIYTPSSVKGIHLYKKGIGASYIYTSSLICGSITAEDALVTSTKDQKVKVKVPITLESSTGATTINATSDNAAFDVTGLTDVEAGDHTIVVEYTPAEYNTTETANITLTATNGATATFTVSGRSLPETFVIATKVGNIWYALPSQGLTSETIPVGCPIEVDNNDNPTTVTAVPANADWSLRQVSSSGANDRYTANGENLVFVNAENKTLYASNSNANIQTFAEYSNYAANNPDRYEWLPTTTDLATYTLKNVGREKNLSINTNATFGTHASNVASSNIRFLPIQNRYTPAALQVVEWKENSVVIMYNGDPVQTASVSVNGGAAQETSLSSAKRDIAVYELTANGLAANPAQRLSITIGTEKVILSIPYIINSETTDEAVLPGSSVAARQEVAKVSDLVILKGATLTAAGAGYKFRNVTIYGGGKLVIPSEKGFGVNSLTLRAGGVTADGNYDYVYPQFVLNGTWSNTSGKINLDYLTTKEQYYTFVAPFAVNTKDIKYPVDIYGNNVTPTNTGSFEFEYYDGATRATGVTGWKTVEEGTEGAILNPGQGYTFLGMPKKVSVNGGSSTRQKFGIHRIPMTVTAEQAMTHENSEQTITVAPHPAEKNINSGWNLIGNPYMSTITGLDNQSIQTGTIVWEDNKWEWSTDDTYNQRFIVFPSNDGQWYTTAQASNATLPAFKNFFVQIIDDEAVNALGIPHTSRTNPSAAPARHAAEEIDRDIELAIVLEKDEQNADQMDFLLNNTYGHAFDRNADFTKMMNNTNFNLYGVHMDDCLSFVAMDQYTAAQPVAIGYQVPTAGEYMLRMSDKPYVMADRIKALYVTDHEMKPEVTTDILKEPYRFTVGKAETNHTRFTISIELKPSTGDGVTTGWENVDVGKDQPIKFIYQDKLYILRNGVIYDATGKFVQTINK